MTTDKDNNEPTTTKESCKPFSDAVSQELTPEQRKEALMDFCLEVKERAKKPIPEEELAQLRELAKSRKKVRVRRRQV